MAQVEVISTRQGYAVEITYREPFEDIFEIAVHNARFESIIDAHRLKDRVKAAAHGVYPKSVSFALDSKCWNYRSSAYKSCKELQAMAVDVVMIPASQYSKDLVMRGD